MDALLRLAGTPAGITVAQLVVQSPADVSAALPAALYKATAWLADVHAQLGGVMAAARPVPKPSAPRSCTTLGCNVCVGRPRRWGSCMRSNQLLFNCHRRRQDPPGAPRYPHRPRREADKGHPRCDGRNDRRRRRQLHRAHLCPHSGRPRGPSANERQWAGDPLMADTRRHAFAGESTMY